MSQHNGHIEGPLNNIQSSFDAAVQAAQPLLSAGDIEQNSFTFGELWKLKDIKTEWLINDFLPRSVVSLIIGDDGIGKTQICTQLALHIALKFPTYLGLSLTATRHKVLVIATEDNKEKFISAAAKQVHDLKPDGINPDEIGIVFMEASNFNSLDEVVKEIDAQVLKHGGFDLMITDALMDLFGFIDGDVNNNSHAGFILNVLQHVAKKHQSAILVIHHAGKGKIEELKKVGKFFLSKNSQLGAGRITSKSRHMLALSHDPQSASKDARYYSNYLHIVKTNYSSRFYVKHAIHVPFDSNTLLHNYKSLIDIAEFEGSDGTKDPKDKSSSVVKMPEQELTYEQHLQMMIDVFGQMEVLTRKAMSDRMKAIYKVGSNAIENKDGLITKLLSMGLIVKASKGYMIKPTILMDLQGDGSEQINMGYLNPEKPTNNEEEVPF